MHACLLACQLLACTFAETQRLLASADSTELSLQGLLKEFGVSEVASCLLRRTGGSTDPACQGNHREFAQA